ncbi:MAG: hypothetical protein ACP5M4_16040, partial [Acidobacteriaceae bacterium]
MDTEGLILPQGLWLASLSITAPAVLNEKGTQVAISLGVVLWSVEAWRYWSRFWGDCAQFALV